MKKKFTKKYIQSVIRTEDRTQIYRLFTQVNGVWKGEKEMMKYAVITFVEEYAPSKRIYDKAREIIYPTPPAEKFPGQFRKYEEFADANVKHIAMKHLRYELSMPYDNYTKLPMVDGTNLYFASPIYGVDDYNIHFTTPIKGNERFCELLCKVGKRYLERSKAEG